MLQKRNALFCSLLLSVTASAPWALAQSVGKPVDNLAPIDPLNSGLQITEPLARALQAGPTSTGQDRTTFKSSAAANTSAKAAAALSPFEQQLADLLSQGDLRSAYSLIANALKEARKNKAVTASLLYTAAYSAYSQENYGDASRTLKEIADLPAGSPGNSLSDQVVLNMAIAECYYQERNWAEAEKYYKMALLCCGQSDVSTLKADILEGLVGCYLNSNNWAAAEAPAIQLLTIKREENSIAALCPRFWANMYLSQIYAHLNNDEQRIACQTRMNALLKTIMRLKNQYEAQYGELELRTMHEQLLQQYMAEVKPGSFGESLWLAATYKAKSMPLYCWRPTDGQPVKALIVAIHGLGLENRAFKFFGKEMAARGFVTYALDVRGFGAWADAAGGEAINFEKCCKDIAAVTDAMKRIEPGLPVFLLGESMGGAIVLNAAADLDGQLNGVIASVPSAERVGARKLNMTVAVHFLQGPNKSFNFGSQVAAQATKKPELRAIWANDIKAKNDFSPRELITFALFMQKTLGRCRDIKKTPVFMVQGLKDKLVKPQGTVDLFKAVSQDDKTILMIGNEEHLILETDTQAPLVLGALDTWMTRRAKPLGTPVGPTDPTIPAPNAPTQTSPAAPTTNLAQ